MPEKKQYIVSWTENGEKKYLDFGGDRKTAGIVAENIYENIHKENPLSDVSIIIRERIRKT